MRGICSLGIQCLDCGRPRGCPSDKLCPGCRAKRLTIAKRLKHWPDDYDQLVRDAYCSARNKVDLGRNITAVARHTGHSRAYVVRRAQSLGLAREIRLPWTAAEENFLREKAGEIPVSQIQRLLGRGKNSVWVKMKRLKLSMRVTAGYSIKDVCQCFGVTYPTVKRWIDTGQLRWSGPTAERTHERNVRAFIVNHPELWSAKRIDEAWFKALIFPQAGCFRAPIVRREPARANQEQKTA
jgi:hypothetical protein